MLAPDGLFGQKQLEVAEDSDSVVFCFWVACAQTSTAELSVVAKMLQGDASIAQQRVGELVSLSVVVDKQVAALQQQVQEESARAIAAERRESKLSASLQALELELGNQLQTERQTGDTARQQVRRMTVTHQALQSNLRSHGAEVVRHESATRRMVGVGGWGADLVVRGASTGATWA